MVYTYNLYCAPVLYIRIYSGKLGGEYKLKFKIFHGKNQLANSQISALAQSLIPEIIVKQINFSNMLGKDVVNEKYVK